MTFKNSFIHKAWQAGRQDAPPESVLGKPKCLGDMGLCVLHMNSRQATRDERHKARTRLEDVYQAPWEQGIIGKQVIVEKGTVSLSEIVSGSAGGYLVPPEIGYSIMKDVAEDAIFWPRAQIELMQANTKTLPFPDPTQSLGVSQVTNLIGGIRMKWQTPPEEAANETEPQYDQIELNAWGLSGIAYSTNDLAWDYQGLDAHLRGLYTRAVAWYSDQGFFQGNGAGAPQGILAGPGTVKVARAAPNAVAQSDLSNMMQQLLPQSWMRAVWAVSPTAMQQIMNLTGLGGILYFIPGEDGSAGMLYGRPFYITEKVPALGSTGDVTLFDPGLYAVGHRGLYIDFSDQDPTSFTQSKCGWRVIWRGDGVPMIKTQLTTANQAATKVSAYIVLQ